MPGRGARLCFLRRRQVPGEAAAMAPVTRGSITRLQSAVNPGGLPRPSDIVAALSRLVVSEAVLLPPLLKLKGSTDSSSHEHNRQPKDSLVSSVGSVSASARRLHALLSCLRIWRVGAAAPTAAGLLPVHTAGIASLSASSPSGSVSLTERDRQQPQRQQQQWQQQQGQRQQRHVPMASAAVACLPAFVPPARKFCAVSKSAASGAAVVSGEKKGTGGVGAEREADGTGAKEKQSGGGGERVRYGVVWQRLSVEVETVEWVGEEGGGESEATTVRRRGEGEAEDTVEWRVREGEGGTQGGIAEGGVAAPVLARKGRPERGHGHGGKKAHPSGKR